MAVPFKKLDQYEFEDCQPQVCSSGVESRWRTRLWIAIDYVWLWICVIYMWLSIILRRVPIIGELLRRITMLSGSKDTNANVCLFIRVLYTLLPAPYCFDRAERTYGHIFLEVQYKVAWALIRVGGFRIMPPPLRALFVSYYGRAMEAQAYIKRAMEEYQVNQIVILGAGFDSSAYRTRDDRIQKAKGRYIRVFEVDLAPLQEVKLAIIRNALGGEEWSRVSEGVVFVPCNFGVDSVYEKLLDYGFDPKAKSAFLWEGVTYYLSKDAFASTIRELRKLMMTTAERDALTRASSSPALSCDSQTSSEEGGESSTLFFDYMSKKTVAAPKWLWRLEQRMARDLGTSFVTSFDDILQEMKSHGFKVVRHYTYEDTIDRFDKIHQVTDVLKVIQEPNSTLEHYEPYLGIVECQLDF